MVLRWVVVYCMKEYEYCKNEIYWHLEEMKSSCHIQCSGTTWLLIIGKKAYLMYEYHYKPIVEWKLKNVSKSKPIYWSMDDD